MRRAFWLAGTLVGVVAGMSLSSCMAHAGNNSDGFIRPETRIRGCITIVDKVRDGSITPTEWMDANKEEFADLQLELKSRNYPPAKAKEMMMGMAITLCMDRKVPGYQNTCVSAHDEEKRDIQIMRTAHIGECWAKIRVGGLVPPPTPDPPVTQIPCEVWNQACRQPAPAAVLPPPPMSPDDLAQFNEDMAIISSPPTSIYPSGHQGERFASCASYWQSLHFNRPPNVRQVLYSVRVARCMYRTGFGFLQSGCSPDFTNMLNPRCYVRFG